MVAKRLSRAYNPPVPAGQVVEWIGSPPHNAGVLPLNGDAFKGAHFPELLNQHGDAVLPDVPAANGIHTVVGHGEQGEVHKVSNDTDVNFNETIYDIGEAVRGFRVNGDTIIVWGYNGKVWGSTDGGNNFVLLPLYLNSGSPGNQSANREIKALECGNGVWVAIFGDYIAINRNDVLNPADWVAGPSRWGGLVNGPSNQAYKLCTDDNGNWLCGGSWHQWAWTNDDWLTINLDPQPNGSNGATQKVPNAAEANYSQPCFCWCSDDGVFFAGSLYQSNIYRSDDGMVTWTPITVRFNTGSNVYSSPALGGLVDMGSGHYMALFGSKYVAETYDMGQTWIRRAEYTGGSSSFPPRSYASDKAGMLLSMVYNNGAQVSTSKDNGQTFAASIAQNLTYNYPMQYWRGAWYGVFGFTIVRSLDGYVRSEWEVKP